MVKRRNSPYASHKRDVPSRQPCDFTPKITTPTGRRPPPPRPPPSDEARFDRSFII
jgi:hypothetical protein